MLDETHFQYSKIYTEIELDYINSNVFYEEEKMSFLKKFKVLMFFMFSELYKDWKKRYCAHFWGCIVFFFFFFNKFCLD
jgi:hypothetical protein